MSSLKRSLSASAATTAAKKKKSSVPRYLKYSPANTTIVKRGVRFSSDFSVDGNQGFGFSATYLWVNGASSIAIDGAADMTNLYDSCRVKMVEMILLPSANVHDISMDSGTSGSRNVPYLYIAPDYATSGSTTIASMLQMDGLTIHSFDKAIKRKFYPKLATSGSSGIILPASSYVQTGTDVPYFGIRWYADTATAMPYVSYSVNFIIHYECKNCK